MSRKAYYWRLFRVLLFPRYLYAIFYSVWCDYRSISGVRNTKSNVLLSISQKIRPAKIAFVSFNICPRIIFSNDIKLCQVSVDLFCSVILRREFIRYTTVIIHVTEDAAGFHSLIISLSCGVSNQQSIRFNKFPGKNVPNILIRDILFILILIDALRKMTQPLVNELLFCHRKFSHTLTPF